MKSPHPNDLSSKLPDGRTTPIRLRASLTVAGVVLALVACSNGQLASATDGGGSENAVDASAETAAACPAVPPDRACPPALSDCCIGAQGGCSTEGDFHPSNIGLFCPAGRWCITNVEGASWDPKLCPPTMPEQGTPCPLENAKCSFHCPNNKAVWAICNSGMWCGGPAAPECTGAIPEPPHDGGPAQDADATDD